MHAGLPPPDTFPFASLSCPLSSDWATPCGQAGPGAVGQPQQEQQQQESAPLVLSLADPALVATAQQYIMQPGGYPPLREWARACVAALHPPPSAGAGPTPREVAISQGSSAALDALFRVLLNEGDAVVLERFTYGHVVEADLLPMGCAWVGCVVGMWVCARIDVAAATGAVAAAVAD